MKVKSLIKELSTHNKIALQLDSDISSEVFKKAFSSYVSGKIRFRQETPGSIIFVEGIAPTPSREIIDRIESELARAGEEIRKTKETAEHEHLQVIERYAKALNLPIS